MAFVKLYRGFKNIPQNFLKESSFSYAYSPHSGRNKNQSWWTEEYKEARSYLYETKTSPPDSILLYHIKFIEQIPDYDFLGK